MASDLLSDAARHLVREVRRAMAALDATGGDAQIGEIDTNAVVDALAGVRADLGVALRVYLNTEGGQRAAVDGAAIIVPMWYEVLCPTCQTPLPSPETGWARDQWQLAEVANNRAVWCEACAVNVPIGRTP